jgi:hypothetical protein
MQHLTSCLIKCDDTQYRNLKVYIQAIAFAHNTAFNSAINCTPFEAGHGLRARTVTEARASPRPRPTAGGESFFPEPAVVVPSMHSKLLGTFKLPKFDGVPKSWKQWDRDFGRFLGLHQLEHVLLEDFLLALPHPEAVA